MMTDSIMQHMGRRAETPPNATAFGANVRRRRKDLGLSETDLGNISGLSRSTISAVERGKYKSFDMSTAEKIAESLGATIEELRRPEIHAAASSEIVNEFKESKWYGAIQATEAEIGWLASLPKIVWHGEKPTNEMIAGIVLWRRSHEKR